MFRYGLHCRYRHILDETCGIIARHLQQDIKVVRQQIASALYETVYLITQNSLLSMQQKENLSCINSDQMASSSHQALCKGTVNNVRLADSRLSAAFLDNISKIVIRYTKIAWYLMGDDLIQLHSRTADRSNESYESREDVSKLSGYRKRSHSIDDRNLITLTSTDLLKQISVKELRTNIVFLYNPWRP